MSVLYIRNKETGQFEPVKTIKGNKGDTGAVEGIEYWEDVPRANGKAFPGVSDMIARGDHVHPMPTAEDVGARPDDWTPTVKEVGGVVGILEIDVSTGSSINADSNYTANIEFKPIDGANKYYAATNTPGSPYGYVTQASVSGNTLTVRLRNTSSGSHSVSARMLVIGMA